MPLNSFDLFPNKEDNVETIKPTTEAFLEDFKDTLEKSGGVPKKPSGYYKPSCMNCMRCMYYLAKQIIPIDVKQDAIRISAGQSGTDRHDRIHKTIMSMESMGKDCKWLNVADYIKDHPELDLEVVSQNGNETHCHSKKYNLSFLCDGLIIYKGHLYILEIKTEGLSKWLGRNCPSEYHENQVTCYSLCFNIRDILFVYENRDNCVKKAFIYEVTEDRIESVKKLISDCNGYVDRGCTPPKTTVKYNCTYCDYKQYCKQDK